jgi:small subunit ribosomal protein S16
VAVRIRLTRVGATKQPSYRFVVADSRNARDGRSLETLGHYNPRTDPIEFNVNADRAREWMSRGALPSDTVARLFRQAGILPPLERPAPTHQRPPKREKPAKTAVAPAEATRAPAAEAGPEEVARPEEDESQAEAAAPAEEAAAPAEETAPEAAEAAETEAG